MCGICGVVAPRRAPDSPNLFDAVSAMGETLAHRGPDHAASWVDDDCGVALGHRRLAIIDLTPQGAQPMESASGRFVIVLNGEIYNYETLRDELHARGQRFRGTSDTEVLVAAFEEWGVSSTLDRIVGMFAFAAWDRKTQTITLARDRAGEKPLYYGWQGSTFLFGSELKALRAHPDFRGEIDRDALALYLKYNYIPAPHSIFRGIRKLPAGTFLTMRADASGDMPAPQRYWSVDRGVSSLGAFAGSESDAEAALESLLRDAIRGQMISDVPLGALLSGGIDSSLVVGLMQAQSSRPIKTFTIGFSERAYDEASHARTIANHLGTQHTELYVSPQDAMVVIPKLPQLYDEPFADSSQIPTHLVSELARRSVTVALSGDGADELFGGYDRYVLGPSVWRQIGRIPQPLRHVLASSLGVLRPSMLDQVDRLTSALRGGSGSRGRSRERVIKLADLLRASNESSVYSALSAIWAQPELVVNGVSRSRIDDRTVSDAPAFASVAERMMYLDFMSYLPDDILVKVDRASMAVSLETRAPFLDHRVIEFAWRLPLEMKLHNRVGKRLLRRILHRYVPKELVDRPKMGFAIPVGRWLRGPLRAWAEDLLSEDRLRSAGYFDPAPIRNVWKQHVDGRTDGTYAIWGVLMFEAWRDAAATSSALTANVA